MLFRQLLDYESYTYTYLIADSDTRQACLVDPVLERFERDLALIKELKLTLMATLETHTHADHITAAAKLQQACGSQIIVPERAKACPQARFIKDQEILHVGKITVKAIATPGHTDAHMAYLVNGTHCLTGDALFIRGCGRTDFQGGDPGQLYDVITQKLFTLPDETLVYPGHDYKGMSVSTIGEEKNLNPRLADKGREAFINIMNNLNLAQPQKIAIAVPANERCGFVQCKTK